MLAAFAEVSPERGFGMHVRGDTCIDSLRIGVRVHIETDDGALAATLSGSSLIVLDTNSTFNRELGIDATVDVADVVGSLRLLPSLPPPFADKLYANFSADGSQGSLLFVVAPQPGADLQDARRDGRRATARREHQLSAAGWTLGTCRRTVRR
jgi:hypothetical protein